MNDLFKYINPKDNTNLSKLYKDELHDILLLLKKYLIEYRDTLNLDENITFGLEIEFERKKYQEIEMLINNLNLKKLPWTKTNWVTKQEISINHGGETNSPILKDKKEAWLQIYQIISLINYNAIINNSAASHIHIGKKIINNDIESWNNFINLWTTYENIIYRFGYGEYLNARPLIYRFAAPFANELEKELKKNYKSVIRLTRSINTNCKNYGLNLDHLKSCCFYGSTPYNTIEFRNFNGTLNPIIWQNNINFITKFLIYCNNYDFNKDILDKRRIENKNKFKYPINKYHQINIRQAIELADLIFDNNLDKMNFLKQYFKDFQTNEEYVKSKKLTNF